MELTIIEPPVRVEGQPSKQALEYKVTITVNHVSLAPQLSPPPSPGAPQPPPPPPPPPRDDSDEGPSCRAPPSMRAPLGPPPEPLCTHDWAARPQEATLVGGPMRPPYPNQWRVMMPPQRPGRDWRMTPASRDYARPLMTSWHK
jgi:hypothetical protein